MRCYEDQFSLQFLCIYDPRLLNQENTSMAFVCSLLTIVLILVLL